jgi:hypothetical protein
VNREALTLLNLSVRIPLSWLPELVTLSAYATDLGHSLVPAHSARDITFGVPRCSATPQARSSHTIF